MTNRRNLLMNGAATMVVASLCTPVQAGNRTFTFNEIQDFWRLVKDTEHPSAAAVEQAIVNRFGTLPIKFYGLDSKTNEVRGVEILKVMPCYEGPPSPDANGHQIPEDSAIVEYKVYAGADHIPLSQRSGYFPVGICPAR